ncbi:MAG: tetratricopeptide repeat protein [Synechococcales cyanobacterium T60_A2020_003]|nr:tetratricopeptide repeat protein [Synechococcales cyanobacterium T60_A2020_003]
MVQQGVALLALHRYEDALTSFDISLSIQPKCYYAWNSRGLVLAKLERHEEAIASFDRSIRAKSDNPQAWYGKARSCAALGDLSSTVNNLYRAMILSPNLYKVMAKTDSEFDTMRHDQRFQALMNTSG